MDRKIYGYARVSTQDQNEGRQLIAFDEFNIPEDRRFIDKQSGKDFERAEYKTLKRMLKDSPGSLLIITSIDRLGRNYKDIINEWKEITEECQADIKVLDMPLLDTTQYKDLLGTFISDLILQVLSFVAEQERDNIRKRQAEGIAVAKAKKVKFGRPKATIPDNFNNIYTRWKENEITAVEAMKQLGLKKTTFYNMVKQYEEK